MTSDFLTQATLRFSNLIRSSATYNFNLSVTEKEKNSDAHVRHRRQRCALAPPMMLIYPHRIGDMQTPRQTVSVQALRNTRFLEAIAHGRSPIPDFTD
jgi:hypothetical protein